jgi:hypothetical protein
MHMVTQSTNSDRALRYVAARYRHAQAGVVVVIGASQAGLARLPGTTDKQQPHKQYTVC